MMQTCHLPWLLLMISTASPAAWLGTCPGALQQQGIKVLDTLLQAGGSRITVVAAENRIPDCNMTEIPVPADRLRWVRMLNRKEADALSRGIIIKNSRGETRSGLPQEIIPLQDSSPAPAPAPASVPIGAELLPQLKGTVFGRENRAVLRQDGASLRLECAAGQAAAGALLASPTDLRLPAGATVALKLDTSAEGVFRIGAADAAREKIGESLTLGSIQPGERSSGFALPAGLDKATWRLWVIECPESAAQLSIRSARLEAQPAGETPPRSLWVWEPSVWQLNTASTMTLLAAYGADTIFVTVPLDSAKENVTDAASLQRFIAAAAARGVKVWAVIGDPLAVLPTERDQFAKMARAYTTYNRDSPVEARLSGLQLDIEPYLNSGYQLDTEEWLAAYLDTLARVRTQAMMPLDVAVPSWWGRQRYRNSLFLDHLGSQIDVVSVMNYRTDRQQLIDLAEPFLEWGVRAKKTIRIGLEAGPIPDESLHVFRAGSNGDLWLLPLGDNNLLVSLDAAQAYSAARVFTYSHSITRQGTNTTFHRNIGAMQKLLPQLETVWRAWPSFGGIALHGLDAD